LKIPLKKRKRQGEILGDKDSYAPKKGLDGCEAYRGMGGPVTTRGWSEEGGRVIFGQVDRPRSLFSKKKVLGKKKKKGSQ